MDKKLQVLLASFKKREEYEVALQLINQYFDIVNKRIFLLKNKDDDSKIIFTFNVQYKEEINERFDKFVSNTISLHRKKETNTLYTLNCLNLIVMKETGKDIPDKSHKIEWENYRNSILITKQNEIIRINTELEKIINL